MATISWVLGRIGRHVYTVSEEFEVTINCVAAAKPVSQRPPSQGLSNNDVVLADNRSPLDNRRRVGRST